MICKNNPNLNDPLWQIKQSLVSIKQHSTHFLDVNKYSALPCSPQPSASPNEKKENPPTMQSPPTLVNNTFSDIQRIECTFDRKRKMNFIGLFYHNLFYKNGQFI